MKPSFRNRTEAGHLLAQLLLQYRAAPDVLVLGLARGGVPVAAEIARRLSLPLDVLVVRKLGVPCQDELAMGAIAPGGVCILNDEIIDLLDIESDAIGAVRQSEEQELQRREQVFRGKRAPLEVSGKTVIAVDDGIATGSSMHVAVLFLHQHKAARVVVAAPVIAKDAFRQLQAMGAEAVALEVRPDLRSVGQWFDEFSPITDDEVCRLLGIDQPQRVLP